MTLRVALVAPVKPDPWRAYNLDQGYAGLARQGSEAGWSVEIIDPAKAALSSGHPPIVTGPGPAAVTRALRLGYGLAQGDALKGFDLILAPLAGGLLQPALMRRATGEAFAETAMALIDEAPTASRMEDPLREARGLACLVEDALERDSLGLCDAVIGPIRPTAPWWSASQGPRALTPSRLDLILPAPAIPLSQRPTVAEPVRELVVVGPPGSRYATAALLDALEAIGETLAATGRSVVFIGPWPETGAGLSKTLLGVRAQAWPFAFRMIDDARPQQALSYCLQPGRLALFAGGGGDDAVLAQQLIQCGGQVLAVGDHALATRCTADARRAEPGLAARLSARLAAAPQAAAWRCDAWLAPLAHLAQARRIEAAGAARPAPTVSVCITHSDRPDELALAAASAAVPGQAADPSQIIIVDCGSRRSSTSIQLDALAAQGMVVRRWPERLPQGAARNLAAAEAEGEVLIFLDDDNRLAPGGVRRLAAPIATGRFDVVVSALDLFDGPAGVGAPDARLTFLGDAGAAGLMFNGFGDANFAIRRTAFEAAGGFDLEDLAAFDWAFLAKARAQGLRIGVLQTPAIQYSRRLNASARNWRKSDQHGARQTVLKAYRGLFDGELLAQVLQEQYQAWLS